jgi:primosomal protein N' (replication factor Y) (superfamily II helicase)
MPRFADIAFPTAVRRCFTYRIPPVTLSGNAGGEPAGIGGAAKAEPRDRDACDDDVMGSGKAGSMHDKSTTTDIRPGMRVWVPLKSQMAIGMVVRTHDREPGFETRDIVQALDPEPVLSEDLLRLTEWVHRFYYSSWGEAIQAALPAGMNFVAEPFARMTRRDNDISLRGLEKEVFDFLGGHEQGTDISLKEVSQSWKAKGERALDRLVKKGLVEIWQIPRLRMQPKTETLWDWREDVRGKLAATGIDAVLAERFPDAVPGKEPKWIGGLRTLSELPLPSTRQHILDQPGITVYVWNRIRESGLLSSREVPAGQVQPPLPYEPDGISVLNDDQKAIFGPVLKAITGKKFERFLLYGITGSGKTEIYIHALRETLRQGRDGLILVPEIALTPQTVRRFHRVFGDQIAVLHSRLSDRERYDAWSALQKGKKRVAIGARSAVFAPLRNPGLIIIDEEHDPSYKQEDPAPRYHARETAIMRAYFNNAVILTGSATPSLNSLQASATGKCTMLRLDNRHAEAELPEVRILDLKQYRSAMRGPLAVPLFLAVEEALIRDEQVILLHNRRGFATFIQCNDCGGIVECPHCSVSLTYHRAKRHLRCHYCGYSRLMPRQCPDCDSDSIGELGMGTQKVEHELAGLFPDARIARMDQDTTSGKHAHDRILQQFSRGEAEILMGTQIVAKGLDFPNVTVVGVINSDTELAFPSYRSSERMYQLLSQVAGRSGRGSKPGKVFLQTLMPEHMALQYAQKHDFPGFARLEMQSRKKLLYPPYSRLVKVFFKSADSQIVGDVAETFTGIISRVLPADRVMGPSPSTIARMNNIYSWESHLKIDPDKGGGYMERLFDTAFAAFEKEKPPHAGKVRITVNVDTMH